MANRKNLKNPNGLFLGTPGAGKSFSAKREIVNVFLLTEDDIIIADPENEYGPLVEQFGEQGQVIDISPTSTNYINPMDINLDYSDDENPITLKSDFILSLCDLIIGGKEGLSPIERTIIDRRALGPGVPGLPAGSLPGENAGFGRPLRPAFEAGGAGGAEYRHGAGNLCQRFLKCIQPPFQYPDGQTPGTLLPAQIPGKSVKGDRAFDYAGCGLEPCHRQPFQTQDYLVLY